MNSTRLTFAAFVLLASTALAAVTAANAQTTVTIATVNNGDMICMQGLTDDFTAKHPDADRGLAVKARFGDLQERRHVEDRGVVD